METHTCHCGKAFEAYGSDHCEFCYCEEFEGHCEMVYDAEAGQ